MSNLPPFDPTQGEPVSEEMGYVVFPDAQKYIEQSVEAQGRLADSYRVAKVDDHPVYILYGVYDAEELVYIMCIRTYEGVMN